jgi:hypothetical protein
VDRALQWIPTFLVGCLAAVFAVLGLGNIQAQLANRDEVAAFNHSPSCSQGLARACRGEADGTVMDVGAFVRLSGNDRQSVDKQNFYISIPPDIPSARVVLVRNAPQQPFLLLGDQLPVRTWKGSITAVLLDGSWYSTTDNPNEFAATWPALLAVGNYCNWCGRHLVFGWLAHGIYAVDSGLDSEALDSRSRLRGALIRTDACGRLEDNSSR